MKRTLPLLLAALLCLLLPAGCAGQPAPALPEADYPLDMLFSSGAGAWRTTLTLNADGSFSGQFSDSDMGDGGKDYPNGTVYECVFRGQFVPETPLDVHSYPLTLKSLTRTGPEGESAIRDGIRYILAGPYGLYNDKDEMACSFVLYNPTTPVSGLDEELLSWWPGRFETTPPETLSCWALWNVETGAAFFTDLTIN